MSYSPPPISSLPHVPLARLHRLVLVVVGGVLVGLLVVAGCLTPSPRGMGTHQQLGLPPCTLVAVCGMRCPSCGMTTSWAYCARGQIAAALRANAGGSLLALAAVLGGPWLIISGARGRWLIGPPHEWATLTLGIAVIGITLIDWTLRLSLGW